MFRARLSPSVPQSDLRGLALSSQVQDVLMAKEYEAQRLAASHREVSARAMGVPGGGRGQTGSLMRTAPTPRPQGTSIRGPQDRIVWLGSLGPLLLIQWESYGPLISVHLAKGGKSLGNSMEIMQGLGDLVGALPVTCSVLWDLPLVRTPGRAAGAGPG